MAYPPPPGPQPYAPPGPPPGQRHAPVTLSRKVAALSMGGVAVLGIGIGSAAAGGTESTSHDPVAVKVTVTVTVTASPSPTRAAAPAAKTRPSTVTMPSVVGQNGLVATDKLNGLGIEDVVYGSAEPGAKFVLWPSNWRVISQSPKAGARVKTSGRVVLTMKKLA